MKFNAKSFGMKLGLGVALAASALTSVAPMAEARPGFHGGGGGWHGGGGYRGYRGGGWRGGGAIGAGILGLAVGAAIADRGDRYYYNRGYYDHRRYVTVPGRPGYYYYYDGYPNRYYYDRYYDRGYAPYYGGYGYGYAPPPPPPPGW